MAASHTPDCSKFLALGYGLEKNLPIELNDETLYITRDTGKMYVGDVRIGVELGKGVSSCSIQQEGGAYLTASGEPMKGGTAVGDGSISFGKDTFSYQRSSVATGGGTQAGMSEAEFEEAFAVNSFADLVDGNIYRFDITKGTGHGGSAVDEDLIYGSLIGDIKLDSTTKTTTYKNKYSRIALSKGGKVLVSIGTSENSSDKGKTYETFTGTITLKFIAEESSKEENSARLNTFISTYSTTVDPYQGRTYDGSYSFASSFGELTKALSRASITTGINSVTHPFANFAFSGGRTCHNYAESSIVYGGWLNNYTPFGAVFGKFNNPNTEALLQVGNGNSELNRSNAFEVRRNGDIHASGDIYAANLLLATDVNAQKITSINSETDSLQVSGDMCADSISANTADIRGGVNTGSITGEYASIITEFDASLAKITEAEIDTAYVTKNLSVQQHITSHDIKSTFAYIGDHAKQDDVVFAVGQENLGYSTGNTPIEGNALEVRNNGTVFVKKLEVEDASSLKGDAGDPGPSGSDGADGLPGSMSFSTIDEALSYAQSDDAYLGQVIYVDQFELLGVADGSGSIKWINNATVNFDYSSTSIETLSLWEIFMEHCTIVGEYKTSYWVNEVARTGLSHNTLVTVNPNKALRFPLQDLITEIIKCGQLGINIDRIRCKSSTTEHYETLMCCAVDKFFGVLGFTEYEHDASMITENVVKGISITFISVDGTIVTLRIPLVTASGSNIIAADSTTTIKFGYTLLN